MHDSTCAEMARDAVGYEMALQFALTSAPLMTCRHGLGLPCGPFTAVQYPRRSTVSKLLLRIEFSGLAGSSKTWSRPRHWAIATWGTYCTGVRVVLAISRVWTATSSQGALPLLASCGEKKLCWNNCTGAAVDCMVYPLLALAPACFALTRLQMYAHHCIAGIGGC